MIKVIKYNSLGRANHGWLDARHHFSFASYYNPERTGFGKLLVVNDDTIKGKRGFDTHPHRNMEIITYVRKGAITHKDSQGNEGRTEAGDIQVMSAGKGIYHSEYNLENDDTTLYQIWILPNEENVKPRWEQKVFPKEPVEGSLPILASGNKSDGGLFIHQDATIYGGTIKAGTTLTQPITHQAYILASEGSMIINQEEINQGDAAEITELEEVSIHAKTNSEIIVIDVPR